MERRCDNCGNGEPITEQGWPRQRINLIACFVHKMSDTNLDWFRPEHVCEHWAPKTERR